MESEWRRKQLDASPLAALTAHYGADVVWEATIDTLGYPASMVSNSSEAAAVAAALSASTEKGK